jgi:hypothetical protein
MNMSRFDEARRLSTARRCAALLLMLMALFVLPHTASADTNGSVTGVIVNGTTNTPLPDATVTISRFDQMPQNGQMPQSVDTTTTTDAEGKYEFEGLDASTGLVYAVSVTYLNVVYSSGMIQLSQQAQQTSDITVYETSSDPAGVSIQSRGILLSGIDKTTGVLQITDVYSLMNATQQTLVAGDDGRTLTFEVPKNAAQVSPRPGFDFGTASIEEATVYATAPLRPGPANPASFDYTIPYSASSIEIPLAAAYPTDSLRILVPAGDTDPKLTVSLAGSSLLDGGVVSIGDVPYHVWSTGAVPAGQSLTLKLGALPVPDAPHQLRTVEPALIVLVLVAAAAGVTGWVVMRRGLYRPRPVQVAANAAAPLDVRRQQLSDNLRMLETIHQDGDIDDDAYRVQRRAILEELRSISRAMRGLGAED